MESPAQSEPNADGHVAGIDSLRFLAALWVVFSHFGFAPVFQHLDRSTPAGFILNAGMGVLFSGPAAVVVFFVVSGFCIHYPFVAGRPFVLVPYLIRRYVRITIPMAMAMLLTELSGVGMQFLFGAVLWSLVAELMYYTIYPALRKIIELKKLDLLVVVSFLPGLLIWLMGPHTQGFAIFGWQWNWLLCLPCWLLGVKLAEAWAARLRAVPGDSPAHMGKWRLAVWAASSACAALNFHSPISFAISMNFFAILVYFWLLRELKHFNCDSRASSVLEWAGTWSYSIYLCHIFVSALVLNAGIALDPRSTLFWALRIGAVLAASFLFYVLIEKPSHLLARYSSKQGTRLSRKLMGLSS